MFVAVAGVSLLAAAGAGAAAKQGSTRQAGSSAGSYHFAPRLVLGKRRFGGILPTTRTARPTAPSVIPNGTPPLTYHGGPIQTSSKAYAIFWVPNGYYMSAAYKAGVVQYFTDVAHDSYKTSNVYAASTQYYQCPSTGCTATNKTFESYNVSYGGSTTVTSAFPASGCANYTLGDLNNTRVCLTDAQLNTFVNNVVTTNGWPKGLGAEYFLFTPPLVGSCFSTNPADGCYDPAFSSGYCAYHSARPNGTTTYADDTVYANQPFADIDGCLYSALGYAPYPNGSSSDPTLNVVSHEANETMTDPELNAWYDSSGYENGDECAWTDVATSNNGWGDFDQVIAGDDYLLQSEWSNRANDCVVKNTYPQPTASFTWSPSAPTHGSAVPFTSTVGGTVNGAKKYKWTFGDGASSTAANPSHTYTTAGTKTVTLVVTDGADGDAVRVAHTVAVS